MDNTTGGVNEKDAFAELLDDRKYDLAFDYLMKNPKAMDGIAVYELRNIYHQCFQGLIPDDRLAQFFQKLEERVKSTDL